jgi:hypothetical protein
MDTLRQQSSVEVLSEVHSVLGAVDINLAAIERDLNQRAWRPEKQGSSAFVALQCKEIWEHSARKGSRNAERAGIL